MDFSPHTSMQPIAAAKSAYRFDNDDLIANRNGRLSQRQYAGVWQNARQASSVYAGAVLMLLSGFMAVFVARSADGRAGGTPTLGLATVVVVGFGAAFSVWVRRFGPVLRSRRVQTVSGPVAAVERGRHGAVVIGQGAKSVELQLNERTRHVWSGATTATVYFTALRRSVDVQSVELPACDANNPSPLAPDQVGALEDMTSLATFDALSERYGFTDVDLACNGAGELSPRQRQRYLERGVRQFRAICVVGTAVALWVAYGAGRHDGPIRFAWSTALGVFCAFVALLVACPLLIWWLKYRRAVHRGPRTVTGPVSLVMIRVGVQGARIGATRGFKAAVVPFEAGDEDLFVEGDTMTIHFDAAPTFRMLSAGPADPVAPRGRALSAPKRPVARVAMMWIASVGALLAVGVLRYQTQPAPYELPLNDLPTIESMFDN